jgi:hypothetical protein
VDTDHPTIAQGDNDMDSTRFTAAMAELTRPGGGVDLGHDRAANPDVTGVVLNRDQALASGIAEFGALLRSAGEQEVVGR